MSKLFITPGHGYLGKTIDGLKEAGYEVTLIGWGSPPIYVEADKNEHQHIQDLVEEIDDEAKFSPYRIDQMDVSELNDKMSQLDEAQFINLCTALGVNRAGLSGNSTGNLPAMVADLISRHSKNEVKLAQLVEELYKIDSTLF